MKKLLVALMLFSAPALAQDHSSPFQGPLPDFGNVDPKSDPRVVEITSKLGCNCGTCPHEPVDKCTCSYATRLRAEAAAGVYQGKSKEEIVAAMVTKFGETILPRPPFSGLNLVAYLGPFVVIAAVAVWLGFLMRTWKQRAAAKTAQAKPSAPAADDPYLAAVDAELKKGDA